MQAADGPSAHWGPCGPNLRALRALPFHVCCVQHICGKLYFLSIGKERLVFPLPEIHCGAWKAENMQTTLQLVYLGFLFWWPNSQSLRSLLLGEMGGAQEFGASVRFNHLQNLWSSLRFVHLHFAFSLLWTSCGDSMSQWRTECRTLWAQTFGPYPFMYTVT